MIRLKSRKVISAVLIGTLLFTTAPVIPEKIQDVQADELSEAQEKKEDATAKKEEAQYKLKQLKGEKEDVIQVIEELDSEIWTYQEKIGTLTQKRNSLQASAAVTENNLQDAYIAEAKQYESMKERIQFAYENGDAAYIEALLSIKDYSTVTNQSEYVDKVSAYDQKQLNALLEIEKGIQELKVDISNNLGKIQELKTEAEGEQEALQVMQEGKQEALADYNEQIYDTEYSIEQLEAIEAEQDAQIAAIEAAAAERRRAAEEAAAALAAQQAVARQEAERRAAAEAEAQRAVQQEQGDAETASTTDATEQVQEDIVVPEVAPTHTGGFIWPLPGYYSIGSPFGPRVAPIAGASTYHKGVDIGCPEGTPIVAAGDGIVSYTGYFGGGGNTVIIDHGNGLSTLYMHMSSFGISEGAAVSAGTVIGYAGCTGVATGPHLHFAVRVNGEYVDPMGYL